MASTPPNDPTLPKILAALESIAAAVNRGTDVLVDPADERAPSQEQSTTIVDYLVLRELVGRQFDGTRRTVAATRFADGIVVIDSALPATATKVAVFTTRSIAPDEVADIVEITDGPELDIVAKARGVRRSAISSVTGIVLGVVADNQPIVRLELRRDDDLAVAVGPRLSAVT
jgi:hypothetical protein